MQEKEAKNLKIKQMKDYYERKEVLDLMSVPNLYSNKEHKKILDKQKYKFNVDKLTEEGKEWIKRRENAHNDNLNLEKEL